MLAIASPHPARAARMAQEPRNRGFMGSDGDMARLKKKRNVLPESQGEMVSYR
jgi:hypothetical protein